MQVQPMYHLVSASMALAMQGLTAKAPRGGKLYGIYATYARACAAQRALPGKAHIYTAIVQQ